MYSIFNRMRSNYNWKIFIAFSIWLLSIPMNAMTRPNIIWLMAEDIGPDLECNGMQAVHTPNLNWLAKEGLNFTRCYCTNPICSPNRSAMMVGVHQSRINAQHHRSNRSVPLPEPYKPITWWLRESGYTTILGSRLVMDRGRKIDCNFQHQQLGVWDGNLNFGLFDKFDEITTEDQPFFAQIQLKVTHRGDWWDSIRSVSNDPVDPQDIILPSYLADHPVIRMDWAKYLDQIEYMDMEIGRILEDLKQKELLDNTVIIFIGDNGRCNLRGKGYLHDPGIHVPLIIYGLEGIMPEIRNELVNTIDISATILELCGIEIPAYMDGKSFLADGYKREYIYSTRDRWDEVFDRSASITSERFKYIRNYFPEIPYDAHQAYLEFYRPALHIMRKLYLEGGLVRHQMDFLDSSKPEEELYDLQEDPEELVNLAADAEYSKILLEMKTTLQEEEVTNRASVSIHKPVTPAARRILDYVIYYYPEEFRNMINGIEIGYQKYQKLYRTNLKH